MRNNLTRETDLRRVAEAIVTGKMHAGSVREGDAANKLLIDCDGKPPKFPYLLRDLKRLGITPRYIYYAPSNTRGHWHLVIYMREKMPLLARIFCQYWIGDDKIRAAHNFIRAYYYKRSDKYVQILFGEKFKYETQTKTQTRR